VYYPLPNCAGSRIHVGDTVKLEATVDFISIRSEPDTHPSNNIIGRILPGNEAEIIDGPVCNWRWILWEVQRLPDGLTGWAAESDGHEFWIVPVK